MQHPIFILYSFLLFIENKKKDDDDNKAWIVFISVLLH